MITGMNHAVLYVRDARRPSDVDLLGEEIAAMVEAGVFESEPDWTSMVDPSIAESVHDVTELHWPGG